LWTEQELRRRTLLAALFHDISKGGPEHEVKGAVAAAHALHRFGVDEATTEDVAFLVRNHLLLSDVATRRDLSEESVVVECGNRVGAVERLKMLYLLSYADSRATGPKAWNDWKARLLSELYSKTLRVLQSGVFAEPHAAQTMLKKRDMVRGLAKKTPDELSPTFVEQWLDRMPSRYTLSMPGASIVRHLKLIRELEKLLAEEELRLSKSRAHRGVVALDARTEPGSGIWEVVFAARSQAGLFSAIAGVLSLHDINIFSADSFMWSDGLVLAVFLVSDPPDALYAQEYFAKVRSALKYALTGKLSLDYRLDKKRDSLLFAPARGPKKPVEVNIDNTVTDFYSVIEVRADDRVGLLYEIAHCLEQHHIDAHIAKIATDADRAMDFFYVRDAYGQKVEDPGQQAELVNALKHRLA
jgi:[protein-PII] uridylyltransferase